jgi:hypothetical protein
MIIITLLLILVGGLLYFFPKAAIYLFVCPLLGLCFGGFTWGLTAIFVPPVLSLEGFGCFVGGAWVLAVLWCSRQK